jgi:uncharacterized membrane protein
MYKNTNYLTKAMSIISLLYFIISCDTGGRKFPVSEPSKEMTLLVEKADSLGFLPIDPLNVFDIEKELIVYDLLDYIPKKMTNNIKNLSRIGLKRKEPYEIQKAFYYPKVDIYELTFNSLQAADSIFDFIPSAHDSIFEMHKEPIIYRQYQNKIYFLTTRAVMFAPDMYKMDKLLSDIIPNMFIKLSIKYLYVKDGVVSVNNKNSHIYFSLQNNSNKEVRLWEEWNSWGYYNILFIIITNDSIYTVRKNESFWQKNAPTYFILKPDASKQFDINLNSKDWQGLPAKNIKNAVIQVSYEIPQDEYTREKGVWTGKVTGEIKNIEVLKQTNEDPASNIETRLLRTKNEISKNNPLIDKNQELIKYSAKVIETIKNNDLEGLAEFFSNTGVRFSPYAWVDKSNIKLKNNELTALLKSNKVLGWGSYTGSGDPIKLTILEYFKKFVYDVDFANAKKIAANKIHKLVNTANNMDEFYSDCEFVEYHFSGFDKNYEDMDWKSLRLVYKNDNGKYYLVGIIHDEWTI